MSKRCCAKNCFNSVLYNRSIGYFSFPKNKEFAQRWAELAGRSDLKEKPLSRIVKYFLCSEHFTANCFVDDTRQTLKRKLPHSIAFPSIFKNNLQETVQNANPRHSIEVHNIILLDVDKRIDDSYSPDKQVPSNDSASDTYSQLSASAVNLPKDDFFAYDDLENQCLDVCLHTAESNNREEITIHPPPEPETVPPMKCRLCAKELKNGEPLTQIKESTHLKEFVERVMKDQISVNDDMSQVVCKNCENNALLCFIIIQQMDTAQEKMALPNDK